MGNVVNLENSAVRNLSGKENWQQLGSL